MDLIFDRIEKQYSPGVYALKNLSMKLPSGSFTTLLGPSGCGKSTALNTIAGLVTPTSGQILLGDKRFDTVPSEKRNVGMVFQSYALFPHMTAYENVAFGLRIRKVDLPDIRKKVKEALKVMRLSQYEDRRPGELSGGQQQRLAFARMMVLDPKILLLDEPLSNLDAKLREEMQIEIRNIHDRLKITTVFVTHDQSEAFALSDQIVVMNQGQIEQIGTPEAIFNEPATIFAANFVGYNNQMQIMLASESENHVESFIHGQELKFKKRQGLKAGRTALLLTRPNGLIVSDSQGIEAKVQSSQFVGGQYLMRMHTGTTSLQVAHPTRISVGTEVKLKVRSDDALVFPESAPQ